MILCCGEALIDFLPREGKDGAAVFQPFSGGSVYNTAIALGRLGTKTGLFAGISTDFFGDQLLEGLRASKVDTGYCRQKDKPTTLAFVKLDNGHARYSFVDEGSAGRNLTAKDLPRLPADVTALHFGSISLIPEPCGSTYETLMMRVAASKVISLDPNIRSGQIKSRRQHLVRLYRMIALADIVKISDEDVVWMTRRDDLASAARRWLKVGARIVVITRGGQGVSVFTSRFSFMADAPKVKVADTVGAGDTFTAGFLHHLERKKKLRKATLADIDEATLREAAAFAMKAAAVTVSRPGADPPWATEV
jgi:fructokinase